MWFVMLGEVPTGKGRLSAAPEGVLATAGAVQRALLEWYRAMGRDLPWRRTRDPYAVLVSEMMLQQTRVERVLPKWQAWLERFPTLEALAATPRAEVIRAWQGLGYNVRAVRLHEIARYAVERYGGELPDSLEALMEMKGLGRYTAGAVACFAFEREVAVVDTNVRRVLGRVFLGDPAPGTSAARVVEGIADAVVPDGDAYDWSQALMDLGATVCTAARPACLVCPLLAWCRAAPGMGSWTAERRGVLREKRAAYGTSDGGEPRRRLRGSIVDILRAAPEGEWVALDRLVDAAPVEGRGDPAWVERAVRDLARDGLAVLREGEGGPSGVLEARLPE